MENWIQFLAEAEYSDCPTNPYTLQDIALALVGTIDDEERKAMAIKDLEQKMGSDVTKRLTKLSDVSEVLVAVAAFTAPATAGVSTLITGLIAAAAKLTANLVTANWNKKVDQNQTEIRQLMNLFCIDDETLDLIDDKIEKRYYSESGIFEKIRELYAQALTSAQDIPVPDLTKHLVTWLNNNTEYARSDASEIEMKR